MGFTANPNAEASASFDVVKPGLYAMRVDAIEEVVSKAGNDCWKVRLVFDNPAACDKLDGSGAANNPGSIFDYLTTSPADKQGKLRSFVEAMGKPWNSYETHDFLGLTGDVKIGIEEYNGEQKNVVKRYVKK